VYGGTLRVALGSRCRPSHCVKNKSDWINTQSRYPLQALASGLLSNRRTIAQRLCRLQDMHCLARTLAVLKNRTHAVSRASQTSVACACSSNKLISVADSIYVSCILRAVTYPRLGDIGDVVH